MSIPAARLREMIAAVAETISTHADELTALDSAIGDGDHGTNLKRGADAIMAAVEDISAMPLPDALKTIGTKLVMTIGGASGPLYGTLALAFGKELTASPDDAPAAFRRAVDAVAARGKSQLGQKTMLDVLYPVAEAWIAGRTSAEIGAIAHAEADATRDRKAIRGRASFLGDRSVGHVDPGARSSALLIETVARVLT